MKLGFYYRNKKRLTFSSRLQLVQEAFLSVLDYADVIYMHAAAHTLKPLGAIHHSSLRCITGDSFRTHHCILYKKVGWPSLATQREMHRLSFIYKAVLNKLPFYL